MRMPRRRRIEALLLALAGTCAAAETRTAPNAGAPPVNQLSISGNACGPAALLSAYRLGNGSWQAAETALEGTGDKGRLSYWIRRHGLRPSATLKGRMRWNQGGINAEDLLAAANEAGKPLYLPALKLDDLFRRRGEKPQALVKRTHARFADSLEKGFPPVLSLRRFVLRGGAWVPVQGHFVTVTAVPEKLPRGAEGFAISYVDPWGGKRCEGYLKVPGRPLLAADAAASPCLLAEVPAANIGKKEVRRGETTAVVPAAAIGRW